LIVNNDLTSPIQGYLQTDGSLQFSGSLPSSGASVSMLITNLRVNASQLSAGSLLTGTVLGTFPIQNQSLLLGDLKASLGVKAGQPIPGFSQCQAQTATTNLTLSELFNVAFKGHTRVGVVRAYAPNGVPFGSPFFWVFDNAAANAGTAASIHQPAANCFAFGDSASTYL
jgi:hypothetical protein